VVGRWTHLSLRVHCVTRPCNQRPKGRCSSLRPMNPRLTLKAVIVRANAVVVVRDVGDPPARKNGHAPATDIRRIRGKG
jgi:hypothetical protein